MSFRGSKKKSPTHKKSPSRRRQSPARNRSPNFFVKNTPLGRKPGRQVFLESPIVANSPVADFFVPMSPEYLPSPDIRRKARLISVPRSDVKGRFLFGLGERKDNEDYRIRRSFPDAESEKKYGVKKILKNLVNSEFSYLDSPDFFLSQPSRFGKSNLLNDPETPLVKEFNELRVAEKLKKQLANKIYEEKKMFEESEQTEEDSEAFAKRIGKIYRELKDVSFKEMVFPLFVHCWGNKLKRVYQKDATVTPERLAKFTRDFPEEARVLANQFKDLCSF